MRITENMTSAMVQSMLNQQQENINNLEQQASSGLRINEPSDDPASAQQVLNLQGLLAAANQYSTNIQTGTTWLSQTDSTMATMNNVLTSAKELATQMANSTYGASDRQNAAAQATQLRDEMISLGNNQAAGQYIFGGYAGSQPPFAADGTFSGTDDQVNIEVDQGSYVSINYPGGTLLRGGIPPGSSGTDVIGVLNNLITALTNNDVSGVSSTISGLDSSMSQLQAAQVDVGARENRLQNDANTLTSTQDYLTQAVSAKQDADYTQVLSDLSTQQTVYQATLAVSAKFSQLSLLDYM
jgi:flagellar hook-associated protein 3 FlgL